jgi:hypothetical protein
MPPNLHFSQVKRPLVVKRLNAWILRGFVAPSRRRFAETSTMPRNAGETPRKTRGPQFKS